MIVHLKTNNFSLCLNHEHLKSVLPKNILKYIVKNYSDRILLARLCIDKKSVASNIVYRLL